MQTSRQFWRALDRIPGHATSLLEWRDLLGADFQWALSLLRPTQLLAETLLVDGRVHRAVVHSPDRAVVVAEDGGAAKPIPLADLVIYELHRRSLIACICGTLGVQSDSRPDGRSRSRARIGSILITRAIRCPVFLCSAATTTEMTNLITEILLGNDEPVMILTPTRVYGDDVKHHVRRRFGCLLSLEDAIELVKGRPTITEAATRALETFSDIVAEWESRPIAYETFQLARAGRVWHLAFNRQTAVVPDRDANGLAYIQQLLMRPRQRIAVAKLEEMVTGSIALSAISSGEEAVSVEGRIKVSKKLKRLETAITLAKQKGDRKKVATLRTELQALQRVDESVRGFNGRVRRLGDENEGLRTRITMAIRRAKQILNQELPEMGAHMVAVKCGKTMSYVPETPVEWNFTAGL